MKVNRSADHILCVEKGTGHNRSLKPTSAWYFDGEEFVCSYATQQDAWMRNLTYDEVEAVLIANNLEYTLLPKDAVDIIIRGDK